MKMSLENDTIYDLWLAKIVKAHVEHSWDTADTAESEADDEWFHEQWLSLDEESRIRLCGLSADLHSLRDQEKPVHDPVPLTRQQRAAGLESAFRRRQWDQLLSLLRSPPRFEPRPMVDYLRGRAWMEMGEPYLALLFFDNAARLDPANLSYPALAMECLKSIPDWDEAISRAERYRAAETVAPRLLFRAGDIFHLAALKTERPQLFEHAVEVVDRGMSLLDRGIEEESLGSVVAGAFATKALSLEHLGRHLEALTAMDESLLRFPDNSTLLTERGLLKRQMQMEDADADFEAAIRNGSTLVWPYLELARSELNRRNFGRVVDLCRSGLERSPSDETAAQLFQLLGIARFELHDSIEQVQQAFAASLERNPFATENQTNQERLNASIGNNRAAVTWEMPVGSPLDAIGTVIRRQLATV